MPDIYMDCDTAVIVPMNIMPLIQKADFATIEQAFVYNMAGIAVQWNFVTAAGVMTTVAITPTTGGVYDISEPLANVGMYGIEIPASGGASANNDTEGAGWITGSSTAVLPFRGPTICFRRAALNDLLIEGGTASTNLEDFFDGTGYAGGTAKLTVDLTKVLGTAPTEGAAGRLAAAITKFFDKASPTGTINSLPNAVPDANGGLGTTNGTKFNKTVDLTAGQTIAANLTQILATALTESFAGDLSEAFKTFFNVHFPVSTMDALNLVASLTNLPAVTADWLTAAGVKADAVTKIQNGLATPTNITAASGVALAASQHVIVDSGTVTLANGAHGGAGATITLQTPIAATVPDTQKVDVNTIKTVAVAATATVTFQNGTIPITSTMMSADVKKVNAVTLTGDGSATPWGPA